MPWLLDTDVLSELSRTAPEQRVVDFIESCPLSELYVSTVTLVEIRFGIEQAAEPTRRDALNQWLEQRAYSKLAHDPLFEYRTKNVRWGPRTEETRRMQQ